MKVLFVASELTPIVKVGGLGDVVGSLPKALLNIGVDVSVIIPRYETIDEKKYPLQLIEKNIAVQIGDKRELINLYKTELPIAASGKGDRVITIFLIENKNYLSCGPVYFEHTAFVGSFKEIQRFLFFSKAVFTLIRECFASKFDVIHCHDWHTGALISMLRNSGKRQRTVFTIHNLGNQGRWNAEEVSQWLFKKDESFFKHRDGKFNFIAEGIENADVVTTVSQSYVKEVQTRQYGCGLEGLLRRRGREKKLIGILNGIDYDYWPKLAHSHNHRTGKPRFGFVARLTEQKGLSILLPAIAKIIKKHRLEFYFLGRGDERFENYLLDLARRFPKDIFVKIAFDENLARWIYASSDFFLLPSLFEPSGLGQMIAMRYGSIPIVRATGGLKDTVKNLKTGIVFKSATQIAVEKAIKKAITIFYNKRLFNKIVNNALKQDFSWSKSALKYRRLYGKLTSVNRRF